MRWLESNRNIGTLSLLLGVALMALLWGGQIAGEDVDGFAGLTGALALILGLVLRRYTGEPDES